MRFSGCTVAFIVWSTATLFAAEAPVAPPPLPPALPPLPSELPIPRVTNATRVRRATPATTPAQRQLSLPRLQPATVPPGGIQPGAVTRPYQPASLSDDILRWDSTEKEYHAQPGEQAAVLTFAVTNVSSSNVVINWVRPSCGCTVAKLPPTPWTLKPGEGGDLEFTVDLRGKHGMLSKFISVDTSHGQKFLVTKVHIPQQAIAQAGTDSRTRNMQLAMVDRQVVFRGDCASCHAAPAVAKTKGEEIYEAACAICHDAPHRASMVPDLRALKKATGADYWKMWITHGKAGTLMPGFSKAYGGPLSDAQIKELAAFLYEKFPRAESETDAPAAAASAGPAANLSRPEPSRN